MERLACLKANVQIVQHLNEAVGEFSAGLAGGCLHPDHGQLRQEHHSRQEGPGPPHGSSGENGFRDYYVRRLLLPRQGITPNEWLQITSNH